MNIPTGDDHNDKECDENAPGGPQEPVELPLCPFCGQEAVNEGDGYALCPSSSNDCPLGSAAFPIDMWSIRYEPSPSRSELLAEIAALRDDKDRFDWLETMEPPITLWHQGSETFRTGIDRWKADREIEEQERADL